MAKCEVEPKLDFDKFTEACERFKKICEREMGEAYKNNELIILRPTTFMKAEDFEMAKEVWEKEIPNSIVIPYSMDVLNRKREWIPTSLCLPEEGRPVLVSVKTKARFPKWVEKPTYYYVTDIDVYDDYGWRENGKNVVAWQPLPAPYKGK